MVYFILCDIKGYGFFVRRNNIVFYILIYVFVRRIIFLFIYESYWFYMIGIFKCEVSKELLKYFRRRVYLI